MGLLNKSDFLQEIPRNEKGELLPIEVELEDGSGTVKMLPITRGELQEMQTNGEIKVLSDDVKGDATAEIIARHLVEPALTKAELMDDRMKVFKYGMLLKALLEISGLKTKKLIR